MVGGPKPGRGPVSRRLADDIRGHRLEPALREDEIDALRQGWVRIVRAAMGVPYTLRMTRRPAERWLGGAIPIVFHCVLAAFLFVLGVANAAG